MSLMDYRCDLEAARRRESLRDHREFCRRQRFRLAKRFERSVAVIREARRRAAVEFDGDVELRQYRKG